MWEDRTQRRKRRSRSRGLRERALGTLVIRSNLKTGILTLVTTKARKETEIVSRSREAQ